MNRCHVATLVAALALVSTGCGKYLDPRRYGQVREPAPDSTATTVQIRYLGVGGFLLQRGDDVVMTAPFYTNPKEKFLLGGMQVQPNTSLIEQQLPGRWAQETDAILVGHTHYDHLMDVPHVASTIATNAVLYGSANMKYLALASGLDPGRLVVVTDVAGADLVDYRQAPFEPSEGCTFVPGGAGDWIGVSNRVRIRALYSRHAPVPLIGAPWSGCLGRTPSAPKRVGDWKLGDTYAYLIDFLDAGGSPDFRVYYQDTATPATFGFVPPQLTAEKAVDVALLCAAGFDAVADNPERIVSNTKPRYVVFGHWETFFVPQTHEPLDPLRYFDYRKLVRRMKALAQATPAWAGPFWIAAPGNLFVFEPGN